MRSRLSTAMAVVAGVLALVGLIGLGGLYVRGLSRDTPAPAVTSTVTVAPDSPAQADSDAALKDEIAARPMPSAPPSANTPAVEVQSSTDPLVTPKATGRQVAGVAVYPRSPEGAVAQLAALDAAALRNLSVDTGRQVHRQWSLPGAMPVNVWAPTSTSMRFWQQHSDQDPTKVTADYTPTQGLVKGTADKGQWVLACTLGRLRVSNDADAKQYGLPDCARMKWSDNRWMLDADPGFPALPPVVWPRSSLSYEAGFRDLTPTS